MVRVFPAGIRRTYIVGALLFVLPLIALPASAQDITSPAAVSALVVLPASAAGSLTISWVAPGNDGNIGALGFGSAYFIQYATYPSVSWSTSSAQINISTSAVNPGDMQYLPVPGLLPNTSYYFRLWTKDEGGNFSAPSNLAAAVTPIEFPTSVYFDEVSTTSIVVSGYAPSPAFTGLEKGLSGVNVAIDGVYTQPWRNGNKWTVLASMPTARDAFPVATAGGKLYAIGGYGFAALSINEVYDPVSDTWATKTAMPTARGGLSAAAIGGKIYAVGGYSGASYLNTTEAYDPASNTWSSKAGMSSAGHELAASEINGKLYAVGGRAVSLRNATEVYDPVSNIWSAKSAMKTARDGLSMVAMGGKLYAIGGNTGLTDVSNNEEYAPVTDTWLNKAGMPTARRKFTAGAIGGKLYAVGGGFNGENPLNTNEEYDPGSDTWTTKAGMPTARSALASGVIGGKMYVFGGFDSIHLLTANEEYDPGVASSFTSLKPNTRYTFKAKARNQVGEETGETVSFSTYTLAAAGLSAGPTFTSILASNLTVNWSSGTAASGFNGPGAVYNLQISTAPDFSLVSVSSVTADLQLPVSGLASNTTCYFRVKAANSAGVWGDFLTLGTAVTVLDPRPDTVTALSVFSGGYVGSLALTWPASGNDGNTGALGAGSVFYIQYSTYSSVSWSTAAAQVVQSTSGVAPSTLVGYTIVALDPGTTYYAAVWHKDETGNLSAVSNIASAFAKPFPAGGVTKTVTGTSTWHISVPGVFPYKYVRLAADPAGNIYMAGLSNNGSNDDLLLQKYDLSGDLLLSKYFNGPGNCSEGNTVGVAVDSTTGAFYLAGDECGASGNMSHILIKYDAGGQMLWQRRAQGTVPSQYTGNTNIQTDGSGSIYMSGCVFNAGNSDSWLRKYDPDGNVVWTATQTYTTNSDCMLSLAVKGGYVYAAGSGDMSGFGQGQNATLWKVDVNTGLTQFTTYYNGTAGRNDDYNGVAVDDSGNIYLAGDSQASAANYGLLRQKRDPDGLVQWTSTYDTIVSTMMESLTDLAISADNYLYFAGLVPSASLDFNTLIQKTDLAGNLVGKYTYDAGGRDDAAIDILPAGDKLFLGGFERNAGGEPRLFLRKINSAEVNLPPSAVASLTAAPGAAVGSLSFNWPAPGNDGSIGILGSGSAFYIQYSTYASVSWSTAAAQVAQSTSGVTPSTLVGYTLSALDPGTTYYAAVWHKDEAGNLSAISNIASGFAKPFPPVAISRTANADGTWHISFIADTGTMETGLAADATGNLYLSGAISNGANTDMFVHKYSPSGDLLLAKYFNGAGNCSEIGIPTVAVDTNTGAFYLAGGECSSASTSVNLIIKYDAGGQVVWQRRIAGNSAAPGQALLMTRLDPSGNIYASGYLSNNNNKDAWVGKFSPGGNLLWASTNSFSTNYNFIMDLAVRGPDVYAVGSADMSGLGHGQDSTLWKMNAYTGLTQWTTSYNGAANRNDDAFGVTLDSAGYVYIAGQEQVGVSDYALLTQKRDSSGLLQWTTAYNYSAGAGMTDGQYRIVLSSDNYLYSVGSVATALQGQNAAVIKRDLYGNLAGLYTYDAAGGNDWGQGLVLNGNNAILSGNEAVGGHVAHFVRQVRIADIRIHDVSAPAAVTALAAVPGAAQGDLALSWAAPGDDGNTGTLAGGSAFYIQYATSPAISWSTAAAQISISTSGVPPGEMQARLATGLQNNTAYYFRLWTRDESGNLSAISNEAAAATAIETPARVSFSTVSAVAITASASPASYSNLLLGLSGTNVAIDTNTWTWAGWHAGDGIAADFPGLTPNTRYSFKAKARNQNGVETVESAAVSTYTLANAPASFSAAVHTASSTLSWELNGNPSGTVAQLFRSTDSSAYSALFSGAAVAYADTGLQACTSYYYKVRNINGAGIPTAYASSLHFFTGNLAPLPPDGLEAASLAGRRISLSWLPSPDPVLSYYRLYSDGGTGAVNYNVPVAILPSTVTAFTTGVLVSSPSYTFAVRAVNRCGTEEKNVRVLASAPAMNSLSGVRAAIKEPHSGKKVSGNRLTVMAEIILGEHHEVSSVRFQYKASSASVWADIVPANGNHHNPDLRAPYFVHWDVSHLPSGNYDLRAVASDNFGYADDGAPSVTVRVDDYDCDMRETEQGDGTVKKDQVINNAVASVVQAADAEQSWITKVTIPSDAVSISTATLSIVSNPVGGPSQAADLNPVGQTSEITLSNSQHLLDNGNKAEISLTYPDADNDGVVDGTFHRVERLRIFSYDNVSHSWLPDLACSLDREHHRIIGRTPHFSYFAVFAPAAADLNSARAYPNPWKPGSGGTFDAAGVTFDNLTAGGSIKIFTIAGELVRELGLTAADGGVKVWNGKNSAGSKAASGVYIVRISGGGKDKTLKLAVER